jgi:ATP-binding cassette subfamily F protein uup
MKERLELEGMEAAIATQEEKAAQLEATLNDPQFYVTRSAEAESMAAHLEAAKAEVNRLYTRWDELTRIGAAS